MNEFLLDLVLIVLCISCVILFFDWKNQIQKIHFLMVYVYFNTVKEFIADWFWNNGYNNMPLLHFYTLGEFLLISFFYYKILKRNQMYNKFILFLIPLFSVLIILNTILLQSIYGFNSYAKALVQCTFVGYAIYYFFNTSNKYYSSRVRVDYPILIINAAVLIYYSGSLFVFMFSDFLIKYTDGVPGGFWMFNTILNLIFQIMILTSIWMIYRNKKSIS